MADDFDPFRPLSDDERAAAAQEPGRDGELDAAKPMLPPADAEPPEAAAARLFGRKPDALYRYVDTAGALVFCVCRWNLGEGRKKILPMSWFEGEGWRFAHWPAPRPLYNLDKIAANPNAPIIVCEGEKAADAAALIFAGSVATTSVAGAKASAQTDWTPLSGRRVLIWPDTDSTGEEYAHEVASIVADLECEVASIDTAALARIDPNGGAREPPKKGWDAADAIAEWTNIEALRSTAVGLAKPYVVNEAATGEAKSTPDGENISLNLRAAETIMKIKAEAAKLNQDDIEGAKRLVEAAIAAEASGIEAEQIIKALAKALAVTKVRVEELWRNAEYRNAPTDEDLAAQREAKRREREARRDQIYERCKHIAANPRLIDAMTDLVARLGVVSERRAISATYLTATSRLNSKSAISLLRRGAAASGKNFLADAVFKLIPPESIVVAVGGSPKSLAYYGGADAVDALKHKLLYIPEAAAIADRHGVESEFTTMLRVLISEGRIVYQTVQTQEGSPPVTVTVTKNGPIAVVIISARANIEEEMMTRLMVVDADESDHQTRAIIESTLTEREHSVPADELEQWLDFQRWLELCGPYEVQIPFLSVIWRAHGDKTKAPLRYRRDISGFVTAIKASAIIHLAQRERDDRARIIADLRDYDVAHAAFDHDMGSLYSVNVPETIKAVVRAIEDMAERERLKEEADDVFPVGSAKVTYDALTAAIGINSNDTAGRRLKQAQRLELIEQVEPPGGLGKTTARRYRVLVPSVDLEKRHHSGVFPSPDAVRNAMQSENCTGYTGCTASPAGEGEGLSGQGGKGLPGQDGKASSNQEDFEIAPPRRIVRGRI